MGGLTIVDVKIVDICSKHRCKDDKIPKNKFGKPYEDKDISCIYCQMDVGEVKEAHLDNEYDKRPEDFERELISSNLPKDWADHLWALNQAVTGKGTEFLAEIKKFALDKEVVQK